MKSDQKLHLYEISYSYFRRTPSGGGWRSNDTLNILTTSIGRAIEIFNETEREDAEIHRVEKRDRVASLQIDQELLNDERPDSTSFNESEDVTN